MKQSRELLVDEAIEAEKRIFHALHAAAGPTLLQFDLTMAQLKSLQIIAHHEVLTIGELASQLGISRPTASVQVDRLVQLELIERTEDATDRRKTVIRLSEKGSAIIQRLRRGSYERMQGWMNQLTDGDLLALVQGLQALGSIAAADYVAA